MKKLHRYLVIVVLTASSAGALICCVRAHTVPSTVAAGDYNSIGRPPRIHPDYSGTIIPPNIAPLNFLVQEKAAHYYVKIHSKRGENIEVSSRSPKIMIPEDSWHELLNANRGEQLIFDVLVKQAGSKASAQRASSQWTHFSPITNKIAHESIDGFLAYRRIHPACGAWGRMGIYQRNLQQFDESLVLGNIYFEDGCLNCHTFCNNRTDKMFIGIRSSKYGSSALLVKDGAVDKIGTKFGYTSWHPSGRVAAYSLNRVTQFFHCSRNEVRDVIDLDSMLAYYLVDSKTVKTSPNLSKKDRLESYPTWSADGRYLYFCSAPKWWSDLSVIPERFDQIKYDLVRVSYDLDHDKWGQPETVLSAKDTGRSILLPRVSPEGRWLLLCMCNYGCFPVYQASSDLYIIDLKAAQQTGQYEYRRLDINSDESESWHSWSSNGRWIAFSSKRQSGVFTRIYLAYVDQDGNVHKPILLPQKDPSYYDSCLWTYSVPELITEPVLVTREKLGRVVRSSRKVSVEMPITMATPKASPLPAHDEPWQAGRQ